MSASTGRPGGQREEVTVSPSARRQAPQLNRVFEAPLQLFSLMKMSRRPVIWQYTYNPLFRNQK